MRFHRWVLMILAVYGAAPCSTLAHAAAQQSTPPTPAPTQQSSATADDRLCTVAGNVVSANTGEPLRRAHIELSDRATSNPVPFEVLSDSAGHFTLERVPAGRYDMTVYRDGYVLTRYGQTAPHQSGAVLTLTGGQKMTDLVFRLWKSAAISGRVVDINGDPVQEVQVTVLTRRIRKGKITTEDERSAKTDDLGAFRIFDIEPGRYILTALADNPGRIFQRPPIQEFEQVYYPSTTDASRASAIELKSGDDVSGMDLTLPPKSANRAYSVRGRIQINTDAKDQVWTAVMLLPRGSSPDDGNQKSAEADRKTGQFEFKDLASGEYVVTAVVRSRDGRSSASQSITIVGSDVDNVILVVSKGAAIPARLILEGKAAAAVSRAFVFLENREDEENPFSGEYSARTQKDGSYLWEDVSDGAYRIGVVSDCKECYVKAADANGVDVLTRGVQVTGGGGPGRVDIVYSSESATVNGTVTNKDDLPATGATVVIAPADTRIKSDEYKTSSTDQYGHFEVRGLPPGHYTAYAFDTDDEDNYGDPETLKHFEGRGASVDVAANDHKSVDLKMIVANDPAN